MGLRIAVGGATGNVGREMLSILEERQFEADDVFALASRRSVGVEVSYGDRTLKCKDMETFDFSGIDLVLMSAGSDVSKEWSPKIGAQGPVVIDNSSAWRMDPRVPLIGAGGIHSTQDAHDYLDAGAVAVQVDSVTWITPQVLETIARDLSGVETTKPDESMDDLFGLSN